MVNFNYSGPRITPDTSKIDQASQQSFHNMANIEIDRYKRRQDMLARAMDFINIEVPETALQDQKQLADKYADFKQKSVKFYQGAADQNRELNFDESAFLAKKKSELLKEAQAYNMYHQLLTHATNAYIADPEKYEEEFLTDIAAIDFKNPVEQRTNPMTILASNIYVPGVDLDAFEKSVGNVDKYYVSNYKGDKSLDESELMRNVQRTLSTDPRLFKRGVRGGQWTDFNSASDFLFNYMKDKFTDVTAYHSPAKGSGSGSKTAIPTDYIQPQDFQLGTDTKGFRDFGFTTALDLQKAGPTIVNKSEIQPVSVGFAPAAKEDMVVMASRPPGLNDELGMFEWSKGKLTIKAGSPIPMEVLDQVDPAKYDFQPFVTYRGPAMNDDGTIKKDPDKGTTIMSEDLSIAKYDDKMRAAFGQGTNTKDAYNYIKAYEDDPALLDKAAEQWKASKGVSTAGASAATGGASQKPGQATTKPATQSKNQPIGLSQDDATAILGGQLQVLKDNGYVTQQKDGTLVFNFDNQQQYDAFVKAAEAAGYTMK